MQENNHVSRNQLLDLHQNINLCRQLRKLRKTFISTNLFPKDNEVQLCIVGQYGQNVRILFWDDVCRGVLWRFMKPIELFEELQHFKQLHREKCYIKKCVLNIRQINKAPTFTSIQIKSVYIRGISPFTLNCMDMCNIRILRHSCRSCIKLCWPLHFRFWYFTTTTCTVWRQYNLLRGNND